MWWVSGKNKSFALQIQCDSLDSNCFQFLMGHIRTKLGSSIEHETANMAEHWRTNSAGLWSFLCSPGTEQSLKLRELALICLCHSLNSQSLHTISAISLPLHQRFFLVVYLSTPHTQALRSFLGCFIPAALDPPSSRHYLPPCSSHPHLFYNSPFWYLRPFCPLPQQNPSFVWLQKPSIANIPRALPDRVSKVLSYCQVKATLVYLNLSALPKFQPCPPHHSSKHYDHQNVSSLVFFCLACSLLSSQLDE